MSNGGYRSGQKRVTVEACARIDAGMLKRAGLLSADCGRLWSWSDRGRELYKLIVFSRLAASEIELQIFREGEREPSAKQRVQFSWASCHYGGRRAWLHCPLCRRRCWKLFFYPHTYNGDERWDFFGCRRCAGGGLSYELRNVRGSWLWRERQRKLVKRLGGSGDELPNKRKWQRWKTYARLAAKWRTATVEYNEAAIETFSRLLGIGGRK